MRGPFPRRRRGSLIALDRNYRYLHVIFLIGIILKGFNAMVELIFGSILTFTSIAGMKALVERLAGAIPFRWFNRSWLHLAGRLNHFIAPDTKAFFSWFFLSHGAVKVFIIICLLSGWMWAYPFGIAVFIAFIVFQVVEIAKGNHAAVYAVLTALDIFVILLTLNEWHHARLTKSLDHRHKDEVANSTV